MPNPQVASAGAAESVPARDLVEALRLAAAGLKVAATLSAVPNDRNLPPRPPGPPSQPPVPAVESGDAVVVQVAGTMVAEGEVVVGASARRPPSGPGAAVEAQTPPLYLNGPGP